MNKSKTFGPSVTTSTTKSILDIAKVLNCDNSPEIKLPEYESISRSALKICQKT